MCRVKAVADQEEGGYEQADRVGLHYPRRGAGWAKGASGSSRRWKCSSVGHVADVGRGFSPKERLVVALGFDDRVELENIAQSNLEVILIIQTLSSPSARRLSTGRTAVPSVLLALSSGMSIILLCICLIAKGCKADLILSVDLEIPTDISYPLNSFSSADLPLP